MRLSAIGDVVMTLPAVVAYRESHPDDFIAYATEPASAPLLRSHPAVDRCIVLNFPFWKANLFSLRSWHEIEREARILFRSYDEVISFHALAKAVAISFVAAKQRRGIAPKHRWLQWVFQQTVSKQRKEHYVEFFFQCAGLNVPQNFSYGIQPEKEKVTEFQQWFSGVSRGKKKKPLALLCPLASRDCRMVSFYLWKVILKKLSQEYFCIVDSYGLSQKQLIPFQSAPCAFLPAKFSLAHLVAALSIADFFVGVNSAPAHLAAALKKRGIIIWAKDDPYSPQDIAPFPLQELQLVAEQNLLSQLFVILDSRL